MSKVDLTGQRFSSLVVIGEAGRNKSRGILWKCVCDCGKETVVSSDNLRRHNTKSCGCGLGYDRISKNTFVELFGGTVEIYGGKGNLVGLIDKQDLDKINKYTWTRLNTGYVTTTIKGKAILLHRFIMSAKENEFIDHRDRKPSNCCRLNLRACLHQENCWNQGKRAKGENKYKGVSRKRNKWAARIRALQGIINIGVFETEKEAAFAYDKSALFYHGEFAVTNQSLGLL